MKKLINSVVMIAGALALAGCSGSTPTAVVNGANGLPFASGDVTGGGTLITAVNGRTASTDAVSFGGTSGVGSFQQDTITVVGVDANTIRITYNGATAVLRRSGDGEDFSGADGQTEYTVDQSQPGSDVSAYRYKRSGSSNPEDDGLFHFVVGNISNAANLSGTANYSVLLSGTGAETVNGSPRPLDISGTGTIRADFATTALTGNITVVTADRGNFINVKSDEFSITGTRSGAAFTANMERTNCPSLNDCVSETTLSGNFYGQTGGEIAGVGRINETQTSTSVRTEGLFTFINK